MIERKKWVRPQVQTLGALPLALGDCFGGSTPVAYLTGIWCKNGQDTGSKGVKDHCQIGANTHVVGCLVGGDTF